MVRKAPSLKPCRNGAAEPRQGYNRPTFIGLAKLAAEPREGASEAPTATGEWVTGAGVALGTVGYMSPEQVRGEALDGRTDLFSLGVVLYEMATGVAPFRGATSGTVLSEILTKAPVAPVRLNPEVPAGLSAVIGKTLEKEREARYPSAADLRADLDQLHRDRKSFPLHAPRTFRRTSFRALAAVVLVLLGVGLWSGKDWYRQRLTGGGMPRVTSHRGRT